MSTYVEDLVQNIYTRCDMTGLDKLNQGLQDAIWYSGELHKNISDANKAQRAGFDFHAQAINRSKEAYQVESLRQKLEYQQTNYRAKLAEQQQRWDDARQKRQDKYNKSLRNQNWLLRNAGRFLLGWFSLRSLESIVKTGTKLQLLRKSIEGLTKSTEDWEYIKTQAFEKGIDLETVAKGYRNFYSSAKMAGFDKGGIQQMYSDMLLSTRAIGASTQQTEGALLALEQMLSKGRVSMEELRRQLGNAIPGAFEIGARAMNMTTAEFNNFVQKVGIASSKFIPKFIAQLKKEYADGFKEIAQTVDYGSMQVKVAWNILEEEIMSGEVGKELAKGLTYLAKILKSPEFKQFINVLGSIFFLVMKIVNFVIKHIHIILILLGGAGLAGALLKLLPMIELIRYNLWLLFSGGIINGIKNLVKAVWTLKASFFEVYAVVLLIIGALIILEDIYTGLKHPEKESFTRDIINNYKKQSQIGDFEQDIKNPKFKAFYDKQNPETQFAMQHGYYMTPVPGSVLPNGVHQTPMNFEKQENVDNSVTIGDMHFHINSTNPQESADEIRNIFSSYLYDKKGKEE